jgi:hypothetical protein
MLHFFRGKNHFIKATREGQKVLSNRLEHWLELPVGKVGEELPR